MKFFLRGQDLESLARDLSAGLHHLTFDENFQSFTWQGEIEAGEEVAIENKLVGQSGEKLIPGAALIIDVEGPPTVSRGETEWTTELLYLLNRASTSTTTVIVVFLR